MAWVQKNVYRKSNVAIAASCLITVIVLGIAYLALRQTSNVFTGLVPQAEKMLVSAKDIYSQGLQQGQAIRNIILDPANPLAYENLDKASQEMTKTCLDLIEITKTAGEKKFEEKALEIYRLEQEDLEVIRALKDMVKAGHQDKAIEILNKKETPLWRKNKALILSLNKDMEEYRKGTYAQTKKTADNYLTLLIILTSVPVLISLGLAFFLSSALRDIREMGWGIREGAEQVLISP
jgi:methyl-accepting chemotaxis protein